MLSMKFEFFCIEDPLRRFFFNYAQFVSRHPAPFIILPIIFTGICSIGFFFEKNHTINDAVWLYTPTNGQAKYEAKVSSLVLYAFSSFCFWFSLISYRYSDNFSQKKMEYLSQIELSLIKGNVTLLSMPRMVETY